MYRPRLSLASRATTAKSKSTPPIVSPLKQVSYADGASLPLPSNLKSYTIAEAAEILSTTKKRSHNRGRMMRDMIEKGYVPVGNEQFLRSIMRMKEGDSYSLVDDLKDLTWPNSSTCNDNGCCHGIQSRKISDFAKQAGGFEYVTKQGWYMDASGEWHARGCTNDDIDKSGRCKKCSNVYKNLNKRRHPKMFEDPALKMLSNEELGKKVSRRLKGIDESDISSDKVLKQLAKFLIANGCDRVDIGKSRMFMICHCCDGHRVCKQKKNNGSLCSTCKTKESVKANREKKRIENHDQRTSPHSNTAFIHLTDKETTVRVKKMNVERKKKEATIKRLKKKLAERDVEQELNEEVLNHLKKALEYAQKNQEAMRKDIDSTLLEMLKEAAKQNGNSTEEELLTHEDTKQLVEFIAESMRNHIHKVAGNHNRYRFSSYLTGLAMSQYIMTGKSRYDQSRNDNVIVMPCSGGLARTRQQQKIQVGNCIVMYEKQLLIRNSKYTEEVGQLICDEMKLQEDILINVKSNKMVGFTEDFICKKKIIQNLLDEDKIDNFKEPAKYVNQWRYRSVQGRSFNCEFWYNNGSLNGETLLEQFTQVVINCEIVGCRVLGFCCDAGGGNTGLMTHLRGGIDIPDEVGWLSEDIIRTPNPYDPSRYIFLFHCSTHGMKAMRNQLFTSWTSNGKKQFLDGNGNKIGKPVVEEIYQRDRNREINGVAPLTDIREGTVKLSKWSVMDGSEAKRVFAEKTLAECSQHLYTTLDVPRAEWMKRDMHSPNGFWPTCPLFNVSTGERDE